MMTKRSTLLLLALFATSAWAQTSTSGPAACPTAQAMDHRHLQGTWHVQIGKTAPLAILRLGPHPELGESVRGTLQRDRATAQVVGDVDEGTLTLEESDDGTRISASWTGRVIDSSCGKEIQGTWTPTDAPERKSSFVMRKQGGWK